MAIYEQVPTIGSPAMAQQNDIQDMGRGILGAFNNYGTIRSAMLRSPMYAAMAQRAMAQLQTIQMQNQARMALAADIDRGRATGDYGAAARDAAMISGQLNGGAGEFAQGMVTAQNPNLAQAKVFPMELAKPGDIPLMTAGSPYATGASAQPPLNVTTNGGTSVSVPGGAGGVNDPLAQYGAPPISQTSGPMPTGQSPQQSPNPSPGGVVPGQMLGGGRMLTPELTERLADGRNALQNIQQAEADIKNNPGGLGGISHTFPPVVARMLPQGFGGMDDKQIQQQAGLANLFSEINQERAGMRGNTSPAAMEADARFLPVASTSLPSAAAGLATMGAYGHLPDNDATALDKLIKYEQGLRNEYNNLNQGVQGSNYQPAAPLPPALPGINSALPVVPTGGAPASSMMPGPSSGITSQSGGMAAGGGNPTDPIYSAQDVATAKQNGTPLIKGGQAYLWSGSTWAPMSQGGSGGAVGPASMGGGAAMAAPSGLAGAYSAATAPSATPAAAPLINPQQQPPLPSQ